MVIKYKNKRMYSLTLKDVIETLVTYDIEHCRFPCNHVTDYFGIETQLKGLAMDDKKLILINQELGLEEMREVIIHELLHTLHYRLSDLPSKPNLIEKIVEKETNLTYKKLYGVEV